VLNHGFFNHGLHGLHGFQQIFFFFFCIRVYL
jgi:hypothetical protein